MLKIGFYVFAFILLSITGLLLKPISLLASDCSAKKDKVCDVSAIQYDSQGQEVLIDIIESKEGYVVNPSTHIRKQPKNFIVKTNLLKPCVKKDMKGLIINQQTSLYLLMVKRWILRKL